jgi:hypothetical protein
MRLAGFIEFYFAAGATDKGMRPMTAQPKRDNFGRSEDARMHRLWNPGTRRYLHMAADRETDDINLSWLGYQHQSDTLRDRALADSKPWPCRRRSRDVAKVDVPRFDQVEGIV